MKWQEIAVTQPLTTIAEDLPALIINFYLFPIEIIPS